MLSEIRITGLGVIDDATLRLSEGLTVVTGETGAGKTMVVAGLGLLFGGKADAARVRPGVGKAVVEGRLSLDAHPDLARRAEELGADTDSDGTLIVSRIVHAEGRSRAYVGGRSVPASVLTEFAEGLIAVHGQSDQLRLRRPAEQRSALDRFAGEEVTELLRRHRDVYGRWRSIVDDLAERTFRARERAQEADMLRHGLAEIEAVNPLPGEDSALRAESMRLEHAESLRAAAVTAHQALAGDPVDVTPVDVASLLGMVRRSLSDACADDESLAPLVQRAEELVALASELAADVAAYAESTEVDPARLAAVQERRAALTALTRKYGENADEVLAWADRAGRRLLEVDTSQERLVELARERDALAAELTDLAGALSVARAKAGERFAEAVSAELSGLAMPHASIVVALERVAGGPDVPSIELDGELARIGPDGVDEVELRLMPHPGSPALPLQRGASGGELSRVMLAIEVVFAGVGGPSTMVFDEVDAGVGGRAAVEVGRRLGRLARTHQVLSVTHLPQVAAFADQHLVVVKDDSGAVTKSGVRALGERERPRELARMLAGLDSSDLGIAHAEELLALARAQR